MIAIGSDRMMAAVARARHDVLAPYLKPEHRAHRLDQLADAMHDEGDLRAVPAAARRSRRPARRSYVFSCFNQDQPLDDVDFPALDARLRQNSVQEKLTAQWIERLTDEEGVRSI